MLKTRIQELHLIAVDSLISQKIPFFLEDFSAFPGSMPLTAICKGLDHLFAAGIATSQMGCEE